MRSMSTSFCRSSYSRSPSLSGSQSGSPSVRSRPSSSPSYSRSRSRSPSSGPRRPHREHTPSSSAAASRSHSKDRRARPGGESPTQAGRNQFCTSSDSGHNRAQHQLSSASGGVAARLAPRDDNADHSPVFYAGGFGHPAIESDIRDLVECPLFTVIQGQIQK